MIYYGRPHRNCRAFWRDCWRRIQRIDWVPTVPMRSRITHGSKRSIGMPCWPRPSRLHSCPFWPQMLIPPISMRTSPTARWNRTVRTARRWRTRGRNSMASPLKIDCCCINITTFWQQRKYRVNWFEMADHGNQGRLDKLPWFGWILTRWFALFSK